MKSFSKDNSSSSIKRNKAEEPLNSRERQGSIHIYIACSSLHFALPDTLAPSIERCCGANGLPQCLRFMESIARIVHLDFGRIREQLSGFSSLKLTFNML